MASFAGKVIAVTGAASGIGLAVAHHLASLGANVSLTDSSEAMLQAAATEIAKAHGDDKILSRVADVRDSAAVDAWIQATVSRFGRLDGAVNAAGAHSKNSGVVPIWELDEEEWNFTLDVNLTGMFNCVKAQLKHMVAASGTDTSRSIVVFGSTSSITGAAKIGPYTASKHGVVGLSRCAAKDAAPFGIRVNAVCP